MTIYHKIRVSRKEVTCDYCGNLICKREQYCKTTNIQYNSYQNKLPKNRLKNIVSKVRNSSFLRIRRTELVDYLVMIDKNDEERFSARRFSNRNFCMKCYYKRYINL